MKASSTAQPARSGLIKGLSVRSPILQQSSVLLHDRQQTSVSVVPQNASVTAWAAAAHDTQKVRSIDMHVDSKSNRVHIV